jgi:hypothetical protein
MELHRAQGSYVRFFAIAQDVVRLGMKLDVKESVRLFRKGANREDNL